MKGREGGRTKGKKVGNMGSGEEDGKGRAREGQGKGKETAENRDSAKLGAKYSGTFFPDTVYI